MAMRYNLQAMLYSHEAPLLEPPLSQVANTPRPATTMLRTSDGSIAYDVQGSGPLVICVPGMGDLRSVYRFLTPEIVARGFRVATVDLRGHGDSDATFSRVGDAATGQDLLALIQHLGGPAVLVGNSIGAGAAVWAAAERPDLISGLVLIGPFVRDVPAGMLGRLLFRVGLARPWARQAWLSYIKRLYPSQPPADLKTHIAMISASLKRPGHLEAFRRTARISHAEAEVRLSEVSTPTLVIMGDRDPDFPAPAAEGRFVAERLRGDLLIVPGAGHYPQAEFPGIVAPAILRLLKQRAPRA